MNSITGGRRKRPVGPRIQVMLMATPDGKWRVTNSSHKLGIDEDERFPGNATLLGSRLAIKVAAVVGVEPQELEVYDRQAEPHVVELLFTGDAVTKFVDPDGAATFETS